MHHGVEALEINLRQVTDVFANFGNLQGWFPEITPCEEVRVQADHFIPGGTQQGPRHSTDITFMASQQYSHPLTTPNCSRFDLAFVQRAAIPVVGTLRHSSRTSPVSRSILTRKYRESTVHPAI